MKRHAIKTGVFLIAGMLVAACGGGGGGGGGGGLIGGGGGGGPVPIASITLSMSGTPTAGTQATFPVTVTAKDAMGGVISGAYASAITLADSDPTGATTIAPFSVSNSSTPVTLSYNGSSGFKGATITASTVGNVSGQLTIASAGTCAAVVGVSGYIPCDLQDAYALPGSAGVGQTVAIVDAFDDPNAEADLGVYRAKFGLPACTTANGCFKKVNQTGQQSNYPAANTGWALEESLDVDMASAICPNCKIILVEATTNSDSNLGLSVNEAVALGATEVSNSYGGNEGSGETAFDTYYNHPGVVITVSSGDSGYGVEYPAASPYVTAVGGTHLTAAANNRGWNETVWSGAGSGCSLYETKQAWQTDPSCAKRMVADVSAVADPATGVALYDTYMHSGWLVVGGTSVSSPIIAAVYALAGNAATVNYGSFPYLHPGGLNDITAGSNGSCPTAYFCNGEVGYDGPTGLGTPNGTGGLGSFTQALSFHAGSRHTPILPGAGAPTQRVCNIAQPGYFACYAIEVLR
jgi:subtilase family serine protease